MITYPGIITNNEADGMFTGVVAESRGGLLRPGSLAVP
jgi:hypothetical protein